MLYRISLATEERSAVFGLKIPKLGVEVVCYNSFFNYGIKVFAICYFGLRIDGIDVYNFGRILGGAVLIFSASFCRTGYLTRVSVRKTFEVSSIF